jgi:predicted transcriptional regulator
LADEFSTSVVELATELTVAWLGNSNTRVSADEVPAFLQRMHETVAALASNAEAQAQPLETEAESFTPAVSVRKSLSKPDVIISMIDGKPYKTLRRHLSGHGLTPDEYRARYGLKADYPMVAPAYSEARRDMAKRIGLGRKPGETRAPAGAKPTSEKRGRKTVAEARAAAKAHLGGSAD